MNDKPAEPASETDLGPGATPSQSSRGRLSGDAERDEAYRVLARKYRPASFADLIGQDALVRTLSNAIRGGRVAHAFILTGVRGVGKTTTARILARALNCVGPDGQGEATPEPCGVCEHCTAIAEDRHVDVIEMDAASRTGIDDIRELIEGVRYRPVSARTKVYIIDEVHMLSRQAFNGLLKTLEEPPEHVVFVFATTEIRKVPVTVLSRCQRFDLRRFEQDTLARHLATVCEAEGVTISEPALAMIARAADGSARDGLSLLDQAIALAAPDVTQGAEPGAPIEVEAERVKAMLGLSDRTRSVDLFEAVMRGEIAEALGVLGELHDGGADPAVLLEDLLELTHFVTRIKLTPAIADDPATPEAERTRGKALAEGLGMASLARTWQILLKGLAETRAAPHPLQAAEMVLIRLAHAGALPSPADLVKRLEGAAPAAASGLGSGSGAAAGSAPASAQQASAPPPPAPPPPAPPPQPPVDAEAGDPRPEPPPEPAFETAGPPPGPEPGPEPSPQADPYRTPESFEQIVDLVRERGERSFAGILSRDVRPVSLDGLRLVIQTLESAPPRIAPRLQELLRGWGGEPWEVSLTEDAAEGEGGATLHEIREAADKAARESAERDPLVQAVKAAFPGAEIVEVRDADVTTGPASDTGPEQPEMKAGTG